MLRNALEDCGMIVFEDIEQPSDMQVKLSNVFGPLKEHPVAAVSRADRNRLPRVIEINAGPDMCIVETGPGHLRLEDIVEFTDAVMHGYGHYHEKYVKVDGEWLMRELYLTCPRVQQTYLGKVAPD